MFRLSRNSYRMRKLYHASGNEKAPHGLGAGLLSWLTSRKTLRFQASAYGGESKSGVVLGIFIEAPSPLACPVLFRRTSACAPDVM